MPGVLSASHPSRPKGKRSLTNTKKTEHYGTQKDYIRQFYSRCHTRCRHYRHPYALQASKRRIAAILHRMAHFLSDIPLGHLFPVRIKAQEPGHIHLLRLVQHSDCRRNRILSACASHDERIRQGKRFGNRLLFQRNPRRQCAQNTLRIPS